MSSAVGVRLILKFNFAQQIRIAGWSEGYDTGFADIPTAIGSAANISAFMSDRCDMLGVGPLLQSARLQAYKQPTAPGAPPLRRNGTAIGVPKFPLPGEAYNKAFNGSVPLPADFAPTVYYIALQTDPLTDPVYSRNYWIAGLPDIADQTNQVLIDHPDTLLAVNKFMKDLNGSNTTLAGKLGISIRSVDRSGANPIKPCTAWNLGPNTYTVPLHGFVVGQPILAIGMTTTVKGGKAPRGKYKVSIVLDANTIALQGAGTPDPPNNTGGFRAAIITFNAVKGATQIGFTKRDKGRPFGQSVGRRRRPLTVAV